MLAADAYPPQSSGNGIELQASFMKQLGKLPCRRTKRTPQRSHAHMKEMPQHNASTGGHQAGQCAQQRPRQKSGQHHSDCFCQRHGVGKNNPHQQSQRGGYNQRTAQVVKHLPQAQAVNAIFFGLQHQRQQLPVAARPAVLARVVHACVVGVIFNKHHITDIGAATHAAFQQIVAEHRFIRNALVKYGMQRLDIEQPFASKRTHAKQVLIHVRGAIAVRVNAALAGKQGMKRRAFFSLRQRRHDTRLQNAIAARHAPF